MAKLDENGAEILDNTPVAIPLKYTRMSKYNDTIREIVRAEFSRAAAEKGFETFEEADDFDVGDDYDPRSPYENEFEGLPIAELRRLKLQDDDVKKASAASKDAEEVEGKEVEPARPPHKKGGPPASDE